jgi:DNA polymerase-3 subunit gamma/tau
MELYKKHRPKGLAAVVGQEDTVAALENLLEQERLPHSLLFTGPSGCGKTTLARILRERLECAPNDFYEINCADFRGIDMVREIRRAMSLAPAGGKCRIWLIDECHKLSNDAQNAILKMLEDTPGHVYFFLATTNPSKLLKTIRTRCTDMPVRSLTDKELEALLKKVVRREKKEVPDEVLDQIVQDSLGSARMALVLLDKVIDLEQDKMLEAARAKAAEENESIELCRALIAGRGWAEVRGILKGLTMPPEGVRHAVLGYARSVMLNAGGATKVARAYLVVDAFRENFYDSLAAGLAAACYEVTVAP